MSSSFIDKIVVSMESAISKYSTVYQCLGVLQGWLGSVKFVLDGTRKPSAPINPVRPLPDDSAPLGAIYTYVTRGRDGGGALVACFPIPYPLSNQTCKNPMERHSCQRGRGPKFLVARHESQLRLFVKSVRPAFCPRY